MHADRGERQAGPGSTGTGARATAAADRPGPALSRVATACHDAYLRSFRSLRLEGYVLDRAARPWTATRGRLGTVVVEHGVDAAPWAATGSIAEGTVVLVFSGGLDGSFGVDGLDAARDAVVVRGAGARTALVARRPGDWYAVSVSEVRLGGIAAGRGPAGAGTAFHGRFQPEDLGRLRALAARAVTAAVSPDEPSRQAAAALEVALVAAVASGVEGGAEHAQRERSPRGSRHDVLDRVDRLLESRSAEPVYVADLCAATGLPERTLRYVLVEQYGTSPIRLLRNRRLCQLRRALLGSAEPAECLASLAARHGFWHMGTLAADYRRLFGELPSETRRAAAEAAERHEGSRDAPFVRPVRERAGEAPPAFALAASGR